MEKESTSIISFLHERSIAFYLILGFITWFGNAFIIVLFTILLKWNNGLVFLLPGIIVNHLGYWFYLKSYSGFKKGMEKTLSLIVNTFSFLFNFSFTLLAFKLIFDLLLKH
jgi:hypothetical protein